MTHDVPITHAPAVVADEVTLGRVGFALGDLRHGDGISGTRANDAGSSTTTPFRSSAPVAELREFGTVEDAPEEQVLERVWFGRVNRRIDTGGRWGGTCVPIFNWI